MGGPERARALRARAGGRALLELPSSLAAARSLGRVRENLAALTDLTGASP